MKNFDSALQGWLVVLALVVLFPTSPVRADPQPNTANEAVSTVSTPRSGHKIIRETGNSCRTATPWCTVKFDSDVTAGNILILVVDTMTSSGTNSITDTCNSNWRREDNLPGSQFFHVFSATAACSGTEVVTVNTNGSPDTEFQVLEVAGLTQNLDGLVRNPSVSINESDKPFCDAIKTTNPDDLVICAVGCQTPVAVVSGPTDAGPDASHWVESAADQKTVDTTILSHEDENAVGSYAAEYKLAEMASWTAITVAYKDATAGSATPNAVATPSF